jgi:hypothetical protein
MRSGRKLGVLKPGALNDVLRDAFLRGGAGDTLQELAEQLVVGVGIYPRSATRHTDGRRPDSHLDQLGRMKSLELVVPPGSGA